MKTVKLTLQMAIANALAYTPVEELRTTVVIVARKPVCLN